MEGFIKEIVENFSYPGIYGITVIYFLILYFVVGGVFQHIINYLFRQNLLEKIDQREVSKGQIRFEVFHSLSSIVVFGFSGVAMIYMIRQGWVITGNDSWLSILGGILLLTIWNEIHFFLVHRIMHLPFFMKNVHYVHHRSFTPTIYSVYSFHWLEALLLSTVPLMLAPIINFSIWAIFLYPLASILLNFSGHCNYRFGKGIGKKWTLFATRHVAHHVKGIQNYGFATDWMDRLFENKERKANEE